MTAIATLLKVQDGVFPHYPRTERQAEFMNLADELAVRAAARAAVYDRENTFPFDTFRDLHASGYLALTVPQEFGGCGANALEVALAQERLARGDGAAALAATMHLGHIGILAQTRTWPPAQFERLCREVVTEGALKGMREGYVDETWAQEHHALWLEDVKSGRTTHAQPMKAQPAAGDD